MDTAKTIISVILAILFVLGAGLLILDLVMNDASFIQNLGIDVQLNGDVASVGLMIMAIAIVFAMIFVFDAVVEILIGLVVGGAPQKRNGSGIPGGICFLQYLYPGNEGQTG